MNATKPQRDWLQPEGCGFQPASPAPGLPIASGLQSTACFFTDRLGSTRGTYTTDPYYPPSSTTRNYYPFGEEITSTSNDQYKFASTYRDAVWDGSQWVATGLDYAIKRYYASGMGRFLAVAGGANASAPQQWNGYSYDPSGPLGVIVGLLDTGSPAPACGGGGAISGRGGGAVALAGPASDGGRGEAPFNILGGLAAGKGAAGGGWARLGGGGGASAQSFPGSDWPEPECCDPDDPFCDPWGDPIEMGQRKSARSARWCGGGGGGGTLCQQCMQNEASNCNRQHSQCLISAAANLAGCMFGCFGVPDCVQLCGLLYTRHVTACDDSLTACLKMIPFTCQSYCR